MHLKTPKHLHQMSKLLQIRAYFYKRSNFFSPKCTCQKVFFQTYGLILMLLAHVSVICKASQTKTLQITFLSASPYRVESICFRESIIYKSLFYLLLTIFCEFKHYITIFNRYFLFITRKLYNGWQLPLRLFLGSNLDKSQLKAN